MAPKDWQIYAILLILALPPLVIANKLSGATPETVNLTGLQIAEMSVSFLDEMRKPDGSYYTSKFCNESGCRKNDYRYIQTNAWPVKAYVGLHEATSDEKYLNKIEEDMGKLIHECELNESNREDCVYVLIQIAEAYDVVKDPRYLELFEDEAEIMPFASEYTNTMLTSIVAHQYAELYRLTRDPVYIGESELYVDEAEKGLTSYSYGKTIYSNKDFEFRNYACWTQLSKIGYYDITKDEKYFNSAKNFFDNAELGDYVTENGLQRFTTVEIEPCIDALLKLYERTTDERYLGEAKTISTKLLEERWDSQFSMKYNGDGGFSLYSCRLDEYKNICYPDLKAISDTSYAIYLFSRMKDAEFTLLQTNETYNYQTYLQDPEYEPAPEIYKPVTKLGGVHGVVVLLVLIAIYALYLYGKQKDEKA